MDTDNTALKRLEYYRRKRARRKMSLAALLLLAFLLAAGAVVVDRSVNALVSGERVISLVDVKSNGTSIEIRVMDHRITVDTSYPKQGLERLKVLIRNFLR